MELLVIFLCALSASATASGNSSEPVPDHIITNGQPAYDGQAPFVVGMAFHTSNQWCSGTIIGDTWILTARACLTASTGVTIYFGATRRSQALYAVSVGSSQYVQNNEQLALVHVPQVSYSNRVRKVALPGLRDQSNRYENRWATTCGWGSTAFTQALPDWLQCVDLQIMSNSECIPFYGRDTITDRILCTRTINGKSICFGDAGSPLVTKQGSIMVGLSLFVSTQGCTLGMPAGFARITSHLNWIRQHTGIYY
ncbi:serine protease 1 [Drosophila obscura]|uniref:serine protease 1 n=1 Tax=Drosophila obscura TaxID=7282 RepID=UPI001BB1ADF5|nr:serine protease 1 [Drosophila obscura]